MRKRITKYLIGIILITVSLIFMLAKSIKADYVVKSSEFSKSRNYFCLNKGYHFRGDVHFDKKTEITGEEYSLPEFKDGNLTRTDKVRVNVLKYIVSESVATKRYNDRRSIDSYIPQMAIWKVTGKTIDNKDAEQLKNEALAYDEFMKGTYSDPEVVDNHDGATFTVYFTKIVKDTGTFKDIEITKTEGVKIKESEKALTADEKKEHPGHTHKTVYEKENDNVIEGKIWYKYENKTSRNVKLWEYTNNKSTAISTFKLEGNSFMYEEDENAFNYGDVFYDGSSYRIGSLYGHKMEKVNASYTLNNMPTFTIYGEDGDEPRIYIFNARCW